MDYESIRKELVENGNAEDIAIMERYERWTAEVVELLSKSNPESSLLKVCWQECIGLLVNSHGDEWIVVFGNVNGQFPRVVEVERTGKGYNRDDDREYLYNRIQIPTIPESK